MDIKSIQRRRTDKTLTDYRLQFQTPPPVAAYMASLIPVGAKKILEPTPGAGNLVRAIQSAGGGYKVTQPTNFFELAPDRYDCIVTNPPFSSKYAFGVPPGIERYGMRLGYYILQECLKRSDRVIALMPWFTLSDSDIRLQELKRFGIKSLTALPRKTFQYARIQTVVIELARGHKKTIFKTFADGR